MFGSDFSPRADPGKIIETLESSTSESTYINNIQSKFARLKKKQEEAELRQASKAPPRDSQIEANPFSPGQLVKRASSSTAKLHGNHKGPFLVIDTPSTSTADIKNLCTGMVVKASVKHLQPWHSSLPVDDEFHSWVAAGDAEEHVIQKVLSQDGDYCQVQWPGNHITTELVSTVQNTSAYKEFSKSVSNTRSRPSRRKRRSDNINNNVNPTPIRPRRSKRRKGSFINSYCIIAPMRLSQGKSSFPCNKLHLRYTQCLTPTDHHFGNIGPSGFHCFENFGRVLLNRSGKTMNSTFWLNRIVFCIFKSIPTMISKALLAIGVEYERNAVSRFSNSDACLEDIEF
ncbi:hypothetical protein P9112_006003 [Eukaryota sp. TZLM1-RC]